MNPTARQRIAIIVALVAGVLIGIVATPTRTPTPKSVVRFPANLSRLVGTGNCTIAEGTTGGNCVLTISPPAPAGSSLTITLTPRIYGKGAWTPIDSSGASGGGSGPDVMTESFGPGGLTQTVNIAEGSTVTTLPIVAIADGLPEDDETIKVTISNAVGVSIDPNYSSAFISIADVDRTVVCDPINYGATPDNAADDDWSAIAQAIACASAGSGKGLVRFGTPGTYNVMRAIDGTILPLSETAGITITGYSSTIKVLPGACASTGYWESGSCAHSIFAFSSTYNSETDTPVTTIQGLTLDGNRQQHGVGAAGGQWSSYESQHTASLYVSGQNFWPWGSFGNGKIRVIVQDVNTKNSPGDGISGHVKADITAWHMTSVDDFRGALVLTGGGSKIRAKNWVITSTDPTKKTGIDFEIDGAAGTAGASYPVSAIVDSVVEDMTLDGDFDVGGYLAEGALPGCINNNPGPGPTTVGQDDLDCDYWTEGSLIRNSKQVFRNIKMSSGPTTIQAGRYHDLVLIENSTLRFGHHTGQDNRIVSAGGEVAFVDSALIADGSRGFADTARYSDGTQGLTIQWGISCEGVNDGFCRQGFPGKVSFLRTSFTDDGTAPNSCVRQYNKNESWNTFTKVNSGPWALDCGTPGYTGIANTDTGTGGPAPTTTTTAVPPTTSVSTTTTTTTPVAGQHKEVETCTLGASVSTNASYPGGQVSSAVFGGDAVGGATLATCTLTSAAAGTFPLSIRYWSTGTFSRPLSVNGTAISPPNGPSYGATGGAWATLQVQVPLVVGTNTIVLDTSYLWVDWIELPTAAVTTTTTTPGATTTTTTTIPISTTTTLAPPPAGCTQMEAESGVLSAWAVIPDLVSGGVYVGETNQVGSGVWLMQGVAGGSTLSMRLRTGGSGATRSLKLNGQTVGTVNISPTDPWAWVTVSALTTVTGSNVIQLVGLSNTAGGLDIDAVRLCSTSPSGSTTTTTSTTTTVGPSTTTTTTTTPTTTTTTLATSRTITLLAWSDRDADAVRDPNEPLFKQASWRIINASNRVISSGTLTTGRGTVTVPNGAYYVRWTLRGTLGATTGTVVPLPTSGATTVSLGVCCSKTIGS